MADRIIFQSNETEPEDKTVLREFEECGNDADMDSVDSVTVILPAEGKVQKVGYVVYEFHISNKDDAFSTDIAV